MKKYISIISKLVCLTLVMIIIFEPSTCVYADTSAGTDDNTGQSLENEYTNGVYGRTIGTPQSVYNVDVTWGDMRFTYRTEGTRIWNQKTHLFDENYQYSWKATGNTVKITNHSNVDVKATFVYEKNENYTSVKGTFSPDSEISLPSAEDKALDDNQLTATNELNLSGSIGTVLNSYTSIGNIKIQIN